MRQASSDLSGLGARIADVSEKINRASVYITTGLFAAQRFARAAAGIFQVANSFETGMASVSTLIDTSTESLKSMSDEVLRIGQRTPVSLDDLTGALYDIRSAGISAGDAMAVLEGSARLAKAGLGSTKEAVDIVTSSINAFGLSGEDADAVYNQVFKTVKAGKTTISQLAQGFGAVAGTVAQAGVKLDDYLASVAALTTTGLPAAQAHTQIRAAIAGLLRETTETKALFDALNVKTFKELVTQSGSVTVAFQRILAATRGNDAMIIKLLGSVEAYNAVVGLAGKQNQAYVQTLVSMRDGSNAVGEAFDKQAATMDSRLTLLGNNLKAVATSIGNVLAPRVKELADKAKDLADWFTRLSPQTQVLVANLIALVGVVTPGVIALGFFANALASLAPVAGAVVAAFGVLSGTIAAMIAATGPIGLFIAAAGLLTTAWFAFKDDILAIWDAVVTKVSDSVTTLVEKLQKLSTSLNDTFDAVDQGQTFQDFSTGVGQAGQVIGSFTTKVEELGTAWKTTTETILPAAAGSFNDGFVTPVSAGLDALTKLWMKHNEEAQRFGERTVKSLMDPTERLIDTQNRLKDALDAGGLTAEQYQAAMAKAAAVSQNAYASMAAGIVGSLEQAFGQNKAVAIASAIVNSYEAFTKALAAYPPPYSYAAAAAALAAGFAQVANIRKTTKSSKSGGGGGTDTASAAPASAPQHLLVEGINPSSLFTGSQMRDLAEQLVKFQKNGGQVVFR